MKSINPSLLTPTGGFGLRNRIVNGDMRIDQANAGAVVNVASATVFSIDKWIAHGTAAAGVFTIAQASVPGLAGFVNYLRATVTTPDAAPAAGSIYAIRQAIEGTMLQDLAFGSASAVPITVGFWCRSSLTGAFSGSIRNGATNRSYPFSFTVNAANTWEFKTVTIAGDQAGTWVTSSSLGLLLSIDLGSGVNFRGTATAWAAVNNTGVTGAVSLLGTNGATLDLTGVQLEPGTVPTPYEQRPFGDMLRLCQREFFKTFNQATAPAQNVGTSTGEQIGLAGRAGAAGEYVAMSWPVVMRAAPTVTTYNPSAANSQVRDPDSATDCSAVGALNVTERGANITCTGNAATAVGNRLLFHLTADARL